MATEILKKLNTSKSSRDRYYITKGGQGCSGLPEHYPDHKFGIVNGIDRGNGYQGYLSITHCLTKCEWFPEEAKKELIYWLFKHENGYCRYLIDIGVIND